MTDLTDNELRAVAYFSVGVSSEGKDASYQLAFAGDSNHGEDGGATLKPIGNSGYSIGTLQTDFGAHPEDAVLLVGAYQSWAAECHPDWILSASDQAKISSDLGRDGNHIRDANFDADKLHYGSKSKIPEALMPASGPDIDQTFKSRLNTYLDTGAGKSFIHQRDVTQVNKLMDEVATPLKETDLYQNATPEDQARIFAVVAKAYNQGDVYGRRILADVKLDRLNSLESVSTKIDEFPGYFQTGRDEALKGVDAFIALRNSGSQNPMHGPWNAVTANPLIDPTTLAADTARPDFAAQYGTVRGIFVDPAQGRAFVQDLEQGASHSYGDPSSSKSRGYYAQGTDLVQWDKDGQGRAFVGGQWSSVSRDDLSLIRNSDHSRELHINRQGNTQDVLRVAATGRSAAEEHMAARASQGAGLRKGGAWRCSHCVADPPDRIKVSR